MCDLRINVCEFVWVRTFNFPITLVQRQKRLSFLGFSICVEKKKMMMGKKKGESRNTRHRRMELCERNSTIEPKMEMAVWGWRNEKREDKAFGYTNGRRIHERYVWYAVVLSTNVSIIKESKMANQQTTSTLSHSLMSTVQNVFVCVCVCVCVSHAFFLCTHQLKIHYMGFTKQTVLP